ncbi:DUF4340 domain-containing protein [Halodesulfovibrio marinisediminis]|uniref:DUF4340 domain-containing protein n=1 Tax=Halodesulfovibrio marinisediminis DSM 17456 TaxID=1121457 RepID=A0A1N6F6W3_9BACT|nr:DUF4340 domain-containing protein [Halodesulfovibrio marinisediminis]SIN90997.1 protein of unknown function [Halodesulfovibrio marinisediminis DSM 17456]
MKKTLLVAIALLLLSAGVVAGVQKYQRTNSSRVSNASWFTQPSEVVEKINLLNNSGHFSFVREKGRWFILFNGKKCLARQDVIESLFTKLREMPPQNCAEVEPEKILDYGLDNPKIRITLSGKNIWHLGIGHSTASGEIFYARKGDGQVCMVPPEIVNLLDQPVATFIDSRLLAVPADRITKIRMQGESTGTWEIERSDDGFTFTYPEALKKHTVNQKSADLFIHTLVNGGASCESNEKLLGAVADFSISVWQKGSSEPTTLVVFKRDDDKDEYKAKDSRQPDPVELSSGLVNQLKVTAFALQEKPIFDVNVGEAVKQKLSRIDGKQVRNITITKTTEGWVDDLTNQELTGMDLFIWRLGELQYQSLPVRNRPESALLSLSWNIYAAEGVPLVELYFYTDPELPEGISWVRLQRESVWYPVSSKLMRDLRARLPFTR